MRVRLRTMLNGDRHRSVPHAGELRFVVRMPSGASGSVRLDAVGLDSRACEVALGTLEDRFPRAAPLGGTDAQPDDPVAANLPSSTQ